MAIVRYRSPWREIDQITHGLNRWFDSDWAPATRRSDWAPAVNVEETGEELLLTAELPGLTGSDVSVELENNVLTVQGEKSEGHKESEDSRYHVWERRYGSFQRSLVLPRTVQADQISADFEDGVLTVRMPKSADAKGRRIEIGVGK